LAELQPELFCEISVELAAKLGIQPGEWVTVATPRGEIEAHALVTPRIQALSIGGKIVHQVGLPFHWGYSGLVKGDIANDLVAISEGAERAHHGSERPALQRKTWTTLARRQNKRHARLANGESRMSLTAFLTDTTTLCIGCKACEVACKEWNEVPDDGMIWSGLSYDNTKSLGSSTWRHVMFSRAAPCGRPAGR
jgi:ferredoxin